MSAEIDRPVDIEHSAEMSDQPRPEKDGARPADINAFADVTWSAEAVGRPLAEERLLSQVVAAVLDAGMLRQTLNAKILRWIDAWSDAEAAIYTLILAGDGLTWSDFLEAAASHRDEARHLESNRAHEASVHEAMLAAQPAIDPSWDEEDVNFARHLSLKQHPLPQALAKALEIIAANEKAARETLVSAIVEARILAFRQVPAGYEFVRPGTLAQIVQTEESLDGAYRFILSSDIPASTTRKKGEGPKTKEKRRRFSKADAFFKECVARAKPGKPWSTKDAAFEDMTDRFPGLSRKEFNCIWRKHRTDDMKKGRKVPIHPPPAENPKP